MANPLRDFFMGTVRPKAELIDAVTPRKTFEDVIVPVNTRRALDQALVQIKKHDLMFHTWGLAERHGAGLGLAFNFAGPPGTGKTICAEAIAHALGKKLLVVRYSEMESLWAGETGKNVSAVFRAAHDQDAVLFFDEADAIAGRRFASVTQGYQREANTVVNVLLKELEDFSGVVIFATNMAANFDPAFERRIRTHVLFEMPDQENREKIWQVQLSKRTPLADDVDFKKLAAEFPVSGGDMKNAVLKAAQMALMEEGPDSGKRVFHRHFEAGMRDVLASKKVMEQTMDGGDGSHALAQMAGLNGAWSELSRSHEEVQGEVYELAERLTATEERALALPVLLEHFEAALRGEIAVARALFEEKIGILLPRMDGIEHKNSQFVARLDSMKEELQIEELLKAETAARTAEMAALELRLSQRFKRFQTIVFAIAAVLGGLVFLAWMR